MTAHTGTFKKIGAHRLIGPWSPVTGMHNYRRLSTDFHQHRFYVAELTNEVAADALANADTYTWIFGHLHGSETLIGAYLIFPRDIDGDTADYHTFTIEVDGTECFSRTTQYGVDSGVAWEIARSETAANRSGTIGEALELIATVTNATGSEVLQAGTVVVVVTKYAE